MSDVILVYGPIRALQEAIKDGDWLKGITLSATFLEVYGRKKLTDKFRGKIGAKELDRLTLHGIILMLGATEMVDQPTYTKMINIRKERNSLLHGLKTDLVLDVEERRKAKKVIKDAIHSLRTLGLQ